MKNYKNLLFLMFIASVGLFSHHMHGLSDDAVVDSIKAYSHLTQSDVDRWKLLWMSPLAEPAASAAGAYGVYKAFYGGSNLTPSQEKLKNILTSDLYVKFIGERQPSETMQNIVTSEWTWALASAAGAWVAAYKLLRPRVQAGLWEKVRNFSALCERLAVTQYTYHNEQQFRQALNQPGNTVWAIGGAVSQKYGFENLIDQANIALMLIDQLESSISEKDRAELNSLRIKVITFRTNAQNNYRFIQSALREEQQARSQQRSEYGKELEIQSKEVGIAGKRIKTLKDQWALLKDIGKTAQEYGPSILAGIGSLALVGKIKDWWSAPAQK